MPPLRLPERLLAPLAGVPGRCAVCRGWDAAAICAECIGRHAAPRPRCQRCAVELPGGAAVCGACLKAPPAFVRAFAAVAYEHPWDGLIARFKFRDALDLAGALAERLHAALPPGEEAAPELVLPVPLADRRLRERGYNQAWELARRVARRRRLPADALLLVRTRDTPHQTDLAPARRAANVRGAFGVDRQRAHLLAGRRVAVVDDVMTTGATFDEAARALLRAGAAAVEAWTLARTPHPDGT